VHLEASIKPHVHNLIHEFLIKMAFTMACPNFKKGLKMVSGPLGIKANHMPSKPDVGVGGMVFEEWKVLILI
jgi:hypothetical protein